MPGVGKLEPFDAEANWDEYRERVEQYFIANDVKDEKRRAVLLTCFGPTTYTLLRNLLAPVRPSEASLETIFDVLGRHFSPKPSEVVASFKFNSRTRHSGETAADFLACLNKLADDCGFGAFRDRMLRDRIVAGINDEMIQRRLLEIPELTLDLAKKTVDAMEAAKKDSQMLSTPIQPNLASTNAVSRDATVKPKRTTGAISCFRCGGGHFATQCRHATATCHKCRSKGHLARVCKGKTADATTRVPATSTRRPKSVHTLDEADRSQDVSPPEVYEMWEMASSAIDGHPFRVEVTVNGTPLLMEIDTGASVSVVSEEMFRRRFPSTQMDPSRVMLKSYSGELSPVQGSLTATVRFGNSVCQDTLYVVSGTCPSLLGRSWMKGLGIELSKANDVNMVTSVQDLVAEYSSIFDEGLGTFKGVAAKIKLQDNARPRFFKPRTVPFAMLDKVNEELQRMEREGVLRPVKTSEWAAPIVPVLKQNGQIRICGDFKVTVNPVTIPERYPIPRVEDLFAKLSGGEKFTKLDLKDAYLQVELDESSSKLVTINTPRGLYQYTRLPFGVTSAPSIFQREMENLLQGLKHVLVYFDDILVTGRDDQDHLKNLSQVLSRLKQAGLKLKLCKCDFLVPQVKYLGHVVSSAGIQPNPEKTEAVLKAPRPTDVKTLQSYLGLINFYRRFLPSLSSVLHPLNHLLAAKTPWTWGAEQEQAFRKSKELLLSAAVLAHYDPRKAVVLICDASPYGVGAVLAHREDSGAERPIAFASRSLLPAERNYSQLDKEALALIFGVTKFRQYLWGREFEAVTDHKPLLGLLAADKPVPEACSPRVLRWALMLSSYSYKLKYRPGPRIANADALSRLPLPVPACSIERPAEVFMLEKAYPRTLHASVVADATSKDLTLAKLRNSLWSGAELREPELKPYAARTTQLSVQENCILLGSRVVIPRSLQPDVLQLLHEGHPGISKMKAVARSHVWWTSLDEDITAAVRGCRVCQENQRLARPAPMMPWPFPEKPWSRLHIDFAGPLKNRYLLIVVDAYSKWIEVVPVSTPSAEATIPCLRVIFACHGLPDLIVSDNGPAFVSGSFRNFLRQNGVKHVLTPPYHPASNGAAERAVQTIKGKLKKAGDGNFQCQLARILLNYRTTPHETTGCTPAELLMGRKLKTALTLLHPDLRSTVLEKQFRQKIAHDKGARVIPPVTQGDAVYAKNFRQGPPWVSATVIDTSSDHITDVVLPDGRCWRRHEEHLRPDLSQAGPSPEPQPELVDQDAAPDGGVTAAAEAVPVQVQAPAEAAPKNLTARCQQENTQPVDGTPLPRVLSTPQPRIPGTSLPRRSKRDRRPPARFSP